MNMTIVDMTSVACATKALLHTILKAGTSHSHYCLLSIACTYQLKLAKYGLSGRCILLMELRIVVRLSPAQVSATEAYGSSEFALALGD